MQVASEHFGNLRSDAPLLVSEVVAYDPVPFRLFNGIDYGLPVLLKQLDCSLGIVGADLEYYLGVGPDIALVHEPGGVILGIDVENHDVAMNLEKVRKTCRSYIHQIE